MGELGRSVYTAAVTALLFVVPALVARTHFGEFLFTRNAMNKRGRDEALRAFGRSHQRRLARFCRRQVLEAEDAAGIVVEQLLLFGSRESDVFEQL